MIIGFVTGVLFFFLSTNHSDMVKIQVNRNVSDSIPTIKFKTKKTDSYDKEFIDCFRSISCKHITLKDSLLIVDNYKSVIPVFLPLMKNIIYSYAANDIKLVLNVKRINFSTLVFSFSKVSGQSDSLYHTGRVVLPCSFYWQEETNRDENGDVYQVYQYIDNGDNKSIGIRICESKATFYYFSDDKNSNIEETPTLIKK